MTKCKLNLIEKRQNKLIWIKIVFEWEVEWYLIICQIHKIFLLITMIIINKMAILMKNRKIPRLEIRHFSLFYHDQRRQFHILHLNIIGLAPYGMSPPPSTPPPHPSIFANNSDTIVILTGYRYSSPKQVEMKSLSCNRKKCLYSNSTQIGFGLLH